MLSATGPPSLRVDIDASYSMLAQRIAAAAAADGDGGALSPLAASLAAVRAPGELSKK